MRAAVGVAVVVVCLGLAGCSLFGKKQAAQKTNPKPFVGSETPAKAETAAMPRDSGTLPGANGYLAGRVVVEATEQPIKASILIKNLDREDAKGSDLDFWTDESGFFTIPKLNAGEPYLLIVRSYDDRELISRTLYVKPPNPTLLVRLDKKYTTPSTPPPPDMPKLPGKKGTAGKESAQERNPAVSIDPPVQLNDSGAQPRGGIAGPPSAASPGTNPAAGSAPNPANIADGGFRRMIQPSETVNIPPPPPPPSGQQPQWDSMPDQRQPAQSAPPLPPGSVRMPNIATPVPSCGLYGNRLDNFALYDLNGKVWEYKRDRRGRLMLLDFWSLNCLACQHCIPYLIELQKDFGGYGLEVIGIACGMGSSVEEQQRNLRPMLNRRQVNYKTLLSGGGPGQCPVMGQFQVDRYPMLFLIDAEGTIIWRSRDGMDENAHYELRRKINDYLVTRQSQP